MASKKQSGRSIGRELRELASVEFEPNAEFDSRDAEAFLDAELKQFCISVRVAAKTLARSKPELVASAIALGGLMDILAEGRRAGSVFMKMLQNAEARCMCAAAFACRPSRKFRQSRFP